MSSSQGRVAPEAQTAGGELLLRMQQHMLDATVARIQDMALANARANLPLIKQGKSIRDLRTQVLGRGDSAVVVAAGPSIKRHDPGKLLKSSGYGGAIVCAESAMAYLLRHGIVPDLVVTVDPHPIRMLRWFGDPALSQEDLDGDDYYRRQDLDTTFADEVRKNQEILDLMAEHGHKIRIALSACTSENVVRRVHDIGMDIYWWNPMLDDPSEPDSVTRNLQRENGLPAVNAGGNVGASTWMMAGAVLGKKTVALTGIDFGYYADTPYKNTQYYYEACELVGEDRLDEIFIRIYNPHLDQWFYTDPAYYWYRQAFLEMASEADYETVNCTEGGILFGEGVRVATLAEFLAETKD